MRQAILSAARPRPSFYFLAVLSAAIAGLGLLANSTAVVIGAMIVAPLMGPILGVALGIVSGSRSALGRSLLAELTGVALVLLTGYALGVAFGDLPVGSELMARANPTVLDLGVALAAGLVAGFAHVNARISGAVAGVAIAVALVPPLASSGVFLGRGMHQESLGAFLLWFANFVSIELAASIVFLVSGIGEPLQRLRARDLVGRFGWSVLLLAGMVVVLMQSLTHQVRVEKEQALVRKALTQALAKEPGAQLQEVSWPRDGELAAVVLTPRFLEANSVRRLESAAAAALGRPIKVVVRSLVARDLDSAGRVYASREHELSERRAREERAQRELVRTVLDRELKALGGAHIASFIVEANRVQVDITGRTELDASAIARVEQALANATGQPFTVSARILLGYDLTSSGIVSDPTLPAPMPAERTAELGRLIERRLAVEILHLFAQKRGDDVLVEVQALSATLPNAEAVRRLEQDIQAYVDPRVHIDLSVSLGGRFVPSGAGSLPAPDASRAGS